ncbi:hypothetical protein PG985_007737 [Apiospora marii]|uniref:uncharacterized protein n=1 Tax=Apiospora marii TaxID=335849 RepID=UPI00313222A4
MASITCLKMFVLAIMVGLALGKNFSPPAARHRFSRDTTHDIGARHSASVAAGSLVMRKNRNRTVSEDHIFYENYQISFSWADSSTPHELLARDGNIIKRAPGSSPDEPVFRLPSCLGCIEALNEPGKVTIDTLSTDYLERQMLTQAVDLLNKCVFYTSVPRPFMDLQEWYDRRALGGADDHPGLSKIATDYACRNNLLTIWVRATLTCFLAMLTCVSPQNMYSGANDVTNAPQRPFSRNYWEVYTAGSWLNFLVQQGQQFTYFENMSRAMARRCGGVVCPSGFSTDAMTMRPKNLKKYGFIWGTVEWPTLLARYRSGGIYAPQKLISIDAANPRDQYYLDFETQEVISTVSKRDPNYLDMDGLLGKRATCDANLNYEPPDEDWFG